VLFRSRGAPRLNHSLQVSPKPGLCRRRNPRDRVSSRAGAPCSWRRAGASGRARPRSCTPPGTRSYVSTALHVELCSRDSSPPTPLELELAASSPRARRWMRVVGRKEALEPGVIPVKTTLKRSSRCSHTALEPSSSTSCWASALPACSPLAPTTSTNTPLPAFPPSQRSARSFC
jgi:hypothetical protein